MPIIGQASPSILTAALLLMSAGVVNAVEPSANGPKIIFHLPLDGNLRAAMAGGRAEPVLSPQRTDFVPGKKGQAVKLWNKPAWSLTYDTTKNLNLSAGTIAFWISPQPGQDKKLRTVFSTGKEKNLNLIRLSYVSPEKGKNSSFQGYFMAKRLRPTQFQIGSWNNAAEKDWKIGDWHHVMLVWNDLRGVALFFDGQPVTGPPTNNGAFVFMDVALSMSLGPALVALDEFIILDGPVSPASFAKMTNTEYDQKPAESIEYKYVH